MLDGKLLGNEIVSAINGDKNNQSEMWEKIAEAIVKHIKLNAVVVPASDTPMMSPPGISGGNITGKGKIQ